MNSYEDIDASLFHSFKYLVTRLILLCVIFQYIPFIYQTRSLQHALLTPPWDMLPNVTLEISKDYSLKLWNETDGTRINHLSLETSHAFLALWWEKLPSPVQVSFMWLLEDLNDAFTKGLEMGVETTFIDSFSHSLEVNFNFERTKLNVKVTVACQHLSCNYSRQNRAADADALAGRIRETEKF